MISVSVSCRFGQKYLSASFELSLDHVSKLISREHKLGNFYVIIATVKLLWFDGVCIY